MAYRAALSIAVLLLSATLSAWISDPATIPDRYCDSVSQCNDFTGSPTACAIRNYDLDGDGICEETCEKCFPLGDNNQPVYTCEWAPDFECNEAPGARCDGYLAISPCLNGVCANLWDPTTESCDFSVPDCVLDIFQPE